MFMMFDRVLLMAEGGWLVFSGSAREIMSYFNSLGLYAPSTYNPADFARTSLTTRTYPHMDISTGTLKDVNAYTRHTHTHTQHTQHTHTHTAAHRRLRRE